MKFLLLIFSLAIFNFAATDLYAQLEEMEFEEDEKQEEVREETLGDDPFTDIPDEIPEAEKYLRDKYEDTYDVPFEDVWNAIKGFLEEKSCMIIRDRYSQTDEGLYKGSIHSDMCVLSIGDTTEPVIKRYSTKIPYIRGGVWANGRMQYKFVVKEQDDGTVHVLLRGEMSGFEEHVTNQVHFWDSNGYLETLAMQNIRRRLDMDPGAF